MTAHRRRRLGQGVAALALLALVGCDRIGNPFVVLGQKPPAPDEFQVISSKPLRMPASIALPEPRPGAPSPLDQDPNRDAVVALMGADTRPGDAASSPGEQTLLAAANAAATEPGIRQTLEVERDFEDSSAPYEPPSIFELLSFGEPPPKDVIDAAAESRRLQSEGLAAAPIDPADRPVVEEPEVEEPQLYPPVGAGRAPRNQLPSSQTTPRF